MNAWLAQHGRALAWAFSRLAAAPVNTLLSLLAVGIALALPAGGQMLLGNALQIVRNAAAAPQISLFLAIDADRKAVDEIATRLKNNPQVRYLHYVPRSEALKRFQAREELAEVLAALPGNPFPDAYVVTPRNASPAAMDELRDEFRRWPKVDHVQLDSAWVHRLDALLRLGRTSVAVLAALLGLGLVAITFTTIRLQVLNQRAEIELSRLLGATDVFICRPFYYFGAVQGLLGGAVAWLIVLAVTLALSGPVAELAALYHASAALKPLGLPDSLLLLGFSASLGWLGAALSLGRHLRDPV
ncbi:MAG TPA: permease-like cell division protein FtsX [Rhodocyclaceae bacterium]|nr:permease-like cell division protein FtsX [Rhodocyclaceae bacterium]